MVDVRSPLAARILSANPHAYESLVVEGGAPAVARQLLDGTRPEQLLSTPARSRAAASAMLAGLWLWHDELDECHRIVQKSPEALDGGAAEEAILREMACTLAFWHAIMHRREGDFSNSKYWYHRVGQHAVYPTLAARAGDVINPYPADKSVFRLTATGWDPDAFVDLVEQVHRRPDDPRHPLAVAVQQIEWQTLFEHCTRLAAG